MSRITVLGGTGYTGANIVAEAASRGHDVTSFSRSVPSNPIDGVTYLTGSALVAEDRAAAIVGADVVIASLAPRGELADELEALYAALAEQSAAAGARFGVVGGFSSLRPAQGADRFAYGDEVPPQFAAEARTLAVVLDDLLVNAPEGLDWFFISPAASYGAHAPGEAIGSYRVGTDIAFFDESGVSAISGGDFALAVLDEIEAPKHSRAQFSVAY